MGHHVLIEVGRTPHRLAGVIKDEIQSGAGANQVLAKGLHAGCMPQIQSEEFQAMGLDLISVPPPDLIDQPSQLSVGDVLAAPAVRANEVVVVLVRVADHVRVRAAREVQPLHDPQVREQVQGAEDRRPADVHAFATAALEKIRRREVASGGRNQLGYQAPVRRCLITCPFERANDAFGLIHLILGLTEGTG